MISAPEMIGPRLGIKVLFIGESHPDKVTAVEVVCGRRPQYVEVASAARSSGLPIRETARFSLAVANIGYRAPVCCITVPTTKGLGRAAASLWPDGVLGAVLLIRSRAPCAIVDVKRYLAEYEFLARRDAVAIGITDLESESRTDLRAYQDAVAQEGLNAPVFAVDVMRRTEVLLLIDVLIANADVKAALGETEST